MMKIIIFAQLIIFAHSLRSFHHACNYTPPNIEEIVHGIHIAPLPAFKLKRTSDQLNLRIHFEYMDSFNGSPGHEDLKTLVMEPARQKLQSVLRAKNPTQGILRVNRQCTSNIVALSNKHKLGCYYDCVSNTQCAGFTIPDKFLNKCMVVGTFGGETYTGSEGTGEENVDIVILVAYTTNKCDSTTLAYAASCFSETQLDRPILGVINLCSNMMRPNEDIIENRKIVEHELIHALGFAADKYAFYRYSDGSPIVPRNKYGLPKDISTAGIYMWNEKIAKWRTRERASLIYNYTTEGYGLVMPNVVKTAQDHFNCSNITSVDLEEVGTLGSAISHFDELFLNEEMMTPSTNGYEDTLSKFTLAVLKDTGWYEIDCSHMEELKYGKNAGCVLPLKGCYNYMQSQMLKKSSIAPFCNKVLSYGDVLECNPNDESYGVCYLTRDDNLDNKYVYFKNVTGNVTASPRYYAGLNYFNERCPIKMTDKNPNYNCRDGNNVGKLNQLIWSLNEYGDNSKCFRTVLQNETSKLFGSSCLKVKCNNDNSFDLYINSSITNCKPGMTFSVNYDTNKVARIDCGNYQSACKMIPIPSYYGSCNFTSFNRSTRTLTINWLLLLFIFLQFGIGYFRKQH